MSLGTACGDSVLWCVTVHTCIQTSRNVFVFSSFHCSISLCTACVDSVFCCSGTASSYPYQSFHFITSFLWVPPVATQFSVLSQTFVTVRPPPVATLLFHLIFLWALWRLSFLLFRQRHWRPLSFHVTASFLWAPPVATQFSVLSYSVLYVRAPQVATLVHRLICLGSGCGDSVFCSVIHTPPKHEATELGTTYSEGVSITQPTGTSNSSHL